MRKTTILFILFLNILYLTSVVAQSTATYDISFQSTWNSADHSTLPNNAHWSNLVGTNHNNSVVFLEIGETASPGIQNVAELGSNIIFNSEVQNAIDSGNAQQWLEQPFSPYAAISSATLSNVTVSENFPLITLASMIAPSPDWMIAVNSLNLWDETMDKWKDTFTLDIFPYDAGTENGFQYSYDNAATNPQGVISSIAGASGYPFNNQKVGVLTITFKSSTLRTDDLAPEKGITISPNPNKTGRLLISNSERLKNISVFDVLGKAVKSVNFSNSKRNQTIDISQLKKGIYIVRLTNNLGETNSKKLIVD